MLPVLSKKPPPTIQLSKFNLRKKSRRVYSVNYLQGFWLELTSNIINKVWIHRVFPCLKPLPKRLFAFKLRWEHIIIAFLLGALLLHGGSGRIVRSQIPSASPAPAIMSFKTLPKLKDVSYAVQTPVELIWVDKRRPIGTYANDYVPGNCTWYVASRLPIPNSLGNANNWAYAMSLAGYTVSATPQVGSIAQTSGDSYLGHVAIVEQVNPDGSFVVSEMNYLGLGAVDSRTATTAEFPNFIKI